MSFDEGDEVADELDIWGVSIGFGIYVPLVAVPLRGDADDRVETVAEAVDEPRRISTRSV